MEKGQDILKRIETIHNLPTLPVVITKLREAISNPNVDARRVATIIEDDPAMMARILKVVNSALYRGRQDVTSLQMAVARMGFNAISNIAMSTTIFSIFNKSENSGFSHEEFWRHCISVGIGTEVLYNHCKSNIKKRFTSDVLQLAGLMHDVGKIVLEQFFHTQFRAAIAMASEQNIPLRDAEKQIMGVDHAEVGAVLAMRWNLSQEFSQVIRWHHRPASINVKNDYRDMLLLVHTADYVCNLEKIGDGGNLFAPGYDQRVWGQLGMSVGDIVGIVEKIRIEAQKSAILMSFVNS
ncbi:MAG: HDOD domain-containing protein [Spartobacteria bacterium]|nr:HDOD domain-containing protein [Spartobacteria bacterium]